MTCLKVATSRDEPEAEDVDKDGDKDRVGVLLLATTRGMNGGKAASVAVDKCWFACRRHDLRAAMSGSGSAI